MLITVTSVEHVQTNIHTYRQAVGHCRSAPERVWHWYYLPREDMIGPSRFIGYQDMNADRYDGEPVNGTETEAALKRLGRFVEVKPADPLYDRTRAAAKRLLPRGKRLHSQAKFHVLKD